MGATIGIDLGTTNSCMATMEGGPSPIARSAPYQFLLHSLSAQQRKKRSPSGASAPMASLLAC